jgi:hypothetical protein
MTCDDEVAELFLVSLPVTLWSGSLYNNGVSHSKTSRCLKRDVLIQTVSPETYPKIIRLWVYSFLCNAIVKKSSFNESSFFFFVR